MKKIFNHTITISLILFSSGNVFSQGIYNTANIVVSGNAFIALENTGFHNNGNFVQGEGTVIIRGTAAANIAAIGGNNTTAFYNLVINKTSKEAQLAGNISVDGNLTMQAGNLELNLFTINLGNGDGKIINENNSSRITGTNGGSIIKTVSLNAPSSANPGNMGIAISSAANLGNTIIKRGHQQQTIAGGDLSIYRYFEIIPTNNSLLNATLQMFYFDDELSGLSKNELGLYESGKNSNTWTFIGKDNNNQMNDWLLKNNIQQLSRFTLAKNNSVTYSAFPNPASGIFYLNIYLPSALQSTIELYDANGRLLQARDVNLSAGDNQLQWDISKFANGVYFLQSKNLLFPVIKVVKQ
jgi:type IX secretion system substrate protein